MATVVPNARGRLSRYAQQSCSGRRIAVGDQCVDAEQARGDVRDAAERRQEQLRAAGLQQRQVARELEEIADALLANNHDRLAVEVLTVPVRTRPARPLGRVVARHPPELVLLPAFLELAEGQQRRSQLHLPVEVGIPGQEREQEGEAAVHVAGPEARDRMVSEHLPPDAGRELATAVVDVQGGPVPAGKRVDRSDVTPGDRLFRDEVDHPCEALEGLVVTSGPNEAIREGHPGVDVFRVDADELAVGRDGVRPAAKRPQDIRSKLAKDWGIARKQAAGETVGPALALRDRRDAIPRGAPGRAALRSTARAARARPPSDVPSVRGAWHARRPRNGGACRPVARCRAGTASASPNRRASRRRFASSISGSAGAVNPIAPRRNGDARPPKRRYQCDSRGPANWCTRYDSRTPDRRHRASCAKVALNVMSDERDQPHVIGLQIAVVEYTQLQVIGAAIEDGTEGTT